MKRVKSIVLATLTMFLAFSPAANAWWSIDTTPEATMERLLAEEFYQIRADNYFLINVYEIVKSTYAEPSQIEKYAIVVNGVVDKIINWDGHSEHEDINGIGTVVKFPENGGVVYLDDKTVLRFAPVSHGAIVSVQVSENETETPTIQTIEKSAVTAPAVLTGTPVLPENTPVVVSQTVQSDNHISVQVQVPTNNVSPNSHVSVQVVADGRSVTSKTPDDSGSVTITNLPQNENITIKTVVRDILTGEEEVSISTAATAPANIPVQTNARNVVEDKLNVSSPVVTNSELDGTGHRVITISTPDIANLDSSKTLVSLLVVNAKSGSSHSVGIGSTAGSISVGSLSPENSYYIKTVIRDLATGKETVINGQTVKGNE